MPLSKRSFGADWHLVAKGSAMSHIVLLDQFRFHHVMQETSGVALVFFSGPHCGACRHLRGVLQDCVASIGGLTVFEVDAGRDLALAQALNVFHLPSMFLYRDGQFHCQLHSEARPERLRAAIDAALARPAEEEP